MSTLTRGRDPFGLAPTDRQRLSQHLEEALRRARQNGEEVLAALTVALDPAVDPSAAAFASRRPDEAWSCFEQPDRDRFALATLGDLRTLGGGARAGERRRAHGRRRAAGKDRFGIVAAAWRELLSTAVADPAEGPRGAGPVATGGFGFAPDGGQSSHWAAFPSAALRVPEVALARCGEDVALTLAALAAPDDTLDDLLARLDRRLAELRLTDLPLLDPAPAGRYRISSVMPPEHYESAVARAVERIAAGELEKVVLAREVQVDAPVAYDPAAVFGVLREAFPACYLVCVGRGEASFIAASPELLVRREGLRASTVALAGSTRRSADPSVDAHLGEQLRQSTKDREEHAIVARRIERTLRPRSVWLAAAPEPALVQVANIQHLATPIRAQLAHPISAVELAGLLHPTPAVGGEPHDRAMGLIPALEGMDRGWYAGALGWTDAAEDGELCVGLRCALLTGSVARCYAGVGVVRDSDPAAELAETEVKLQALLPVLAG
jgi:salicylate biosynthesis isochorismate synthase/menaquinone-specific isochorismate synthase